MTDTRILPGHLLLDVAWILLIAFFVVAVACVLALLGMRAQRRLQARWREHETSALRADLVAIVIGEEPEATESAQRLTAMRRRRGHHADRLLVGMVPKVRGDARQRVLAVLRARGVDAWARRHLRSWRSLTRCRGAFVLGVLGQRGAAGTVERLLTDRSPLVRRVAVRALGMIGDPSATRSLLNAANRDVGLQRDLAQALVQIGPAAAAELRVHVTYAARHGDADDRSGPLAATALGLMAEVSAARELTAAVDSAAPPLRLSAAKALGRLDSPVGVPALQRALGSSSTQLQLAAATSLGRLGADSAIPALLLAVERGDPIVSRQAAAALLELGPQGRQALDSTRAPYAVEAVTIDAMRRET